MAESTCTKMSVGNQNLNAPLEINASETFARDIMLIEHDGYRRLEAGKASTVVELTPT